MPLYRVVIPYFAECRVEAATSDEALDKALDRGPRADLLYCTADYIDHCIVDPIGDLPMQPEERRTSSDLMKEVDELADDITSEERREKEAIARAIADEKFRAEMADLARAEADLGPGLPPPPPDPTAVFHEQVLNELNKIHVNLAEIANTLKRIATHWEFQRAIERAKNEDEEFDTLGGAGE